MNDARTGLVRGVQRIFLTREGRAIRKSDIKPWAPGRDPKLKRSLGPIDGCPQGAHGANAARFSGWPDPDGRWGLAEGPETALAAQQIHGFPVWASIFAGNMAKVDPPHWARHAVLFVDHDRAGQYAGANTHARLTGRPPLLTVTIRHAKTLGADVADVLRKGA